jgi:hypothetical protein
MLAAAVLATGPVWACEPCAEVLGLDETVRQADLVIVGRKTDAEPHAATGPAGAAPDWIDVEVLQVLKGTSAEARLRVNSWDGMCDYGIVVDAHPHVMFLVKPRPGQGRVFYDAVNDGCAVKTYPIDGNQVRLDDESIAVEQFSSHLADNLR